MRVLVCGGRTYRNIARVREVLGSLLPRPTLIIHGGQRGADTLAGWVAAELGIPVMSVDADWNRLGEEAGPRRNKEMLIRGRPELVVAFPGGPGTRDMIRQATRAGVRVQVFPDRHFESKKGTE